MAALSALLGLLALALPAGAVNVNLDVSVVDSSNAAMGGVRVIVMPFEADGSPSTSTVLLATNPSGSTQTVITAGVEYFVGITTPAYGPPLRTQINDPNKLFFVKASTHTSKAYKMFAQTVSSHTLTIAVTSVPATGDLLLAEVFFAQTREPVAFGIGLATSTATTDLQVFNVPPAPPGALGAQITVAGRDKTIGLVLSSSVPFKTSYAVDLSSALPATKFEDNISTRTPTVEVLVLTGSTTPVENCRVSISSFSFNPSGPPFEIFRAEGFTDKSGRVSFYDVPAMTFQLQVFRNGFRGLVQPLTVPPALPNALVKTFIVQPATYSITGLLRYNGAPMTWGEVVVWPDGDTFFGTDSFANKNDPIRSEGRTRIDGTGAFTVQGITEGNLRLTANIRGGFLEFNHGPDGDYGGVQSSFRAGDDRRITITSVTVTVPTSPCASDCPPGTAIVYSTSGVILSTGPVVFDVGPGTASLNGVITGSITFVTNYAVSPSSPIVIPATAPVTVLAIEDFSPDGKQQTGFAALSGTLTSATTSYTIFVTTGTKYRLNVLSFDWGLLNSEDDQAELTSTAPVRKDFALSLSGTLKGRIRLPDGSAYRPRFGSENDPLAHHIQVEIDGENVDVDEALSLDEDGSFTHPNLIAGRYSVTLQPGGKGAVWPILTQRGVVVRTGKTTEITINLKNGLVVQPQIFGLPSLSTVTWNFAVIPVPSGTQMNQRKLTEIFFQDHIEGFGFDQQLARWSKSYMVPGVYDFYLLVGGKYRDVAGPGNPQNLNQFANFIGQAKAVSIQASQDNPQLGSFSQPIPVSVLGSVGQVLMEGRIRGSRLFTAQDLEKVLSNIKEFFPLIPAVMLYDGAGDLRAFAHALPDATAIPLVNLALETRNAALLLSTLAANPPRYQIGHLPPGTYNAVFLTPNYPPVAKSVTLPADANFDVDFDQQQVVTGALSGVVKSSTTGLPLENAVVFVKHRTSERLLRTDALGKWSIPFAPPGIYRIEASRTGFVTAGDKVSLGGSDAVSLDLTLLESSATIVGKVFTRKLPSPLTKEGVKIVAYDETANVADPTGYLPKAELLTSSDGAYEVPGVVAGHLYKLSATLPGKVQETILLQAGTGQSTAPDILLRDAPPEIQVRLRKSPDQPGKIDVVIKSPKELRSVPTASVNHGSTFDAATAVSLTLAFGADRSFVGQFTTTPTNRFYTIKVSAGEVANKLDKVVTYDNVSDARTEAFVHEEAIGGGEVSMDSEQQEFSGIELDAGSLTSSASTDTVDLSDLVGGFFSGLPSVRMVKTDRGTSVSIESALQDLLASEVYEIDLENAQQNKPLTLNLNYDQELVTDTDGLKIYQYDSATGEWLEVPGDYTIDPMSGVVSVEVESIEDAHLGSEGGGGTAPLGSSGRRGRKGRAKVSAQGAFVLDASQSTSQTGQFAVFLAKPPTNTAYGGAGFEIYNLPNPFSLKSKTVNLSTDRGGAFTGATADVRGTLIKYHLPASKGGAVKLHIFNIAGEKVRELDEGDRSGGFIYYSEWDGRNDKGEDCASGVYLLLTQVNGETIGGKAHKMALIK